MNIVHVVLGRPKPETSNGVLKSVYHLSLNQGLMGHNVDILSIRNKDAEKSIQVAENVWIHLHKRHKLRFILDSYLVDFISSNFQDIDIVHFHGGYHPEYWRVSMILKKYHIPYFLSPRGGYQKIANKRNYLLKKIYKNLFEIRIIKAAKKIHALNSQEESDIRSYGVPGSKIVVIPNGVDVDKISNIRDGISHIPGNTVLDQFSLVYCGRIDAYYKGLDVLVETINILVNKRKKSNIKLKLIGPDWKGGVSVLEKLVHNMGIEKSVTFFGAKYGLDKYKIYSASTVFILPSRTEGMPTSVLEAMAFSMPCIVTPQTNVDRRIMEFGGCLFVDLTPVEIADTVEKLIANRDDLMAIGVKGREWVSNNYNYSGVAEQHLFAYKDILSLNKNVI